MKIAWVVGSGGLLGSALCRALHGRGIILFTPAERFCWGDETKLIVQLQKAVTAFSTLVGTEKSWQIYWAAGVGTMHSNEVELLVETRVLSTLLSLVESESRLIATKGCFVLASSAGAVYAGAAGEIITENTPAAPTTAYARQKLRQENLVSTFALRYQTVTALLARISTVYGPGQAFGKQQGLIALIARRMLGNQPVQIYVPFDTIRDYITADDAAGMIEATVRAINGNSGSFTKIIASEQPTTIAEIVTIFKRIVRHAPRIIISSNKLSSVYTRRIQFHSIAVPVNTKISRTSLVVGIAQVMAAEMSAYARSR